MFGVFFLSFRHRLQEISEILSKTLSSPLNFITEPLYQPVILKSLMRKWRNHNAATFQVFKFFMNCVTPRTPSVSASLCKMHRALLTAQAIKNRTHGETCRSISWWFFIPLLLCSSKGFKEEAPRGKTACHFLFNTQSWVRVMFVWQVFSNYLLSEWLHGLKQTSNKCKAIRKEKVLPQ